jgi:hypothetical protein
LSAEAQAVESLGRDQIELSQMLTFLLRGDQTARMVELIDNLEDRLLQLLPRSVRGKQPTYSEMGFGAQLRWDQRIGCFLNTVVGEPIGIFGA